jgi:hypothetical protein
LIQSGEREGEREIGGKRELSMVSKPFIIYMYTAQDICSSRILRTRLNLRGMG